MAQDNLAPELQTMAKELKAQVAVSAFLPPLEVDSSDAITASFEPKNKFPLSLKPKLQDFAFKAIEHRQYDDHFFKILPLIFPYNEFTMRVRFSSTLTVWFACESNGRATEVDQTRNLPKANGRPT